ncbi:hypothetical protein JCM9957A_45620 [Kineosporia succinea]
MPANASLGGDVGDRAVQAAFDQTQASGRGQRGITVVHGGSPGLAADVSCGDSHPLPGDPFPVPRSAAYGPAVTNLMHHNT